MRTPSSLAAALLLAALPAQDQPNPVDFERDVLPILRDNCFECHREPHTDENGRLRRPKAGLVLEHRKGIEAGRKGQPVIVPGKPADSEIYQLVTLPDDDEDRMPPADKKPPLSKEQKDVLRRWIEGGAGFGAWTGDGNGTARGADTAPTAPPRPDVLGPLQKGLAKADPAAIAKAAGGKARIEPVVADGPLLRVSFPSQPDTVTDADLQALLPLREHIAVLQLGRSAVTDAACATMAKLPRLVQLDLRQTAIGDQGLAQLAGLAELRELNLFATRVGDASVPVLQKLPKLEHVWLWQSAVTAGAVQKLREARPTLQVSFVPDLPDPESDAPGGRPGGRRGR